MFLFCFSSTNDFFQIDYMYQQFRASTTTTTSTTTITLTRPKFDASNHHRNGSSRGSRRGHVSSPRYLFFLIFFLLHQRFLFTDRFYALPPQHCVTAWKGPNDGYRHLGPWRMFFLVLRVHYHHQLPHQWPTFMITDDDERDSRRICISGPQYVFYLLFWLINYIQLHVRYENVCI